MMIIMMMIQRKVRVVGRLLSGWGPLIILKAPGEARLTGVLMIIIVNVLTKMISYHVNEMMVSCVYPSVVYNTVSVGRFKWLRRKYAEVVLVILTINSWLKLQ